ncbi:MAG: 4Fe-4S binding protein [Holosporales bacterium]|jgi:ferredoxin|nr:4Fe-4S binding protein [Holosporales bacterium]
MIRSILLGVKTAFKKPITIKKLKKTGRCINIDRQKCVCCAMCVSVCPCKAMTISNSGRVSHDKNKCSFCGMCVRACPKEACTFEEE